MISTTHFHPMLVHFPIALVVFGFIAEIAALYFKKEIYLSRMGFILLIFGTLSAITAWLTGTLFTSEMAGAAGEIKNTHELFAWITLGTLLVASFLRIVLQAKKNENNGIKSVAFVLYGWQQFPSALRGFMEERWFIII